MENIIVKVSGMFMVANVILQLPSPTHAQLTMSVFNNTGHGLPVILTKQISQLTGAIDGVEGFQSAELTGSLDLALKNTFFSCETDGILRMWVDEHLVLDDIPTANRRLRRISSWVTLPPSSGPVPIRIEYTRAGSSAENRNTVGADSDSESAPATLQLLWAESASQIPSVVPASSFLSVVTPAQSEWASLRRNLYEPSIPWQTYAATSMAAHTLMPTGFILRFGVLDLITNETIDNLKPFQRYVRYFQPIFSPIFLYT